MEKIMEEIHAAIWDHDAGKVKELVERALAGKIDVAAIVNDGLVAGMNRMGAKFKAGEVFIPEVLVSARAMAAGMTLIKPLLVKAGVKEKGTILIGTVKDDLHDIGKNLVIMMLEGAGYKVVDLGINVPTESFLRAAGEHKPDVIGIAALLTTTMSNMRGAVQAIKTQYPDAKIIVGGAPVTQRFADEIGADAYATDGAVAVEIADRLIAG